MWLTDDPHSCLVAGQSYYYATSLLGCDGGRSCISPLKIYTLQLLKKAVLNMRVVLCTQTLIERLNDFLSVFYRSLANIHTAKGLHYPPNFNRKLREGDAPKLSRRRSEVCGGWSRAQIQLIDEFLEKPLKASPILPLHVLPEPFSYISDVTFA